MDNLYRVQAASPELASLMRRLKTIYAITGGEVPKTANGKKDGFNEKKSVLISQLSNFDKVRGCRALEHAPRSRATAALTRPAPATRPDPTRSPPQLLDSRDHSGLASDSRDYIRLKLTINTELGKLEQQVKDLVETNKKEVEKKRCAGGAGARARPIAARWTACAYAHPDPHTPPDASPPAPPRSNKLTGEEITARNEVMQAVVTEFHAAFKAARGVSHAAAEENEGAGVGMRVIGKNALMKGQYAGAGIKTKKEQMSGEQLQKLEEINANTREQDAVLDEIGKGVDELKDLAEKMHDEFVLQDKMLTDLDSKADKTQTKIDGVNDRMKDALTKLNDKSTNMCIYLICCVLLLGLGVVFYNIAKKNGKI